MTNMRAIRLFEAHLAVRDLERSIAFYRDVVGLSVGLRVRERDAAFLWIGDRGDSMLGLWSLGSAPLGITSHVAFETSLEDVLGACSALRAAGVTPRSFFGDETNEPSVIGWMPAAAVYLLDPDGHQLEYLAMLDEPRRPEAGLVTWSEWASAEPPRIRVEPYDGPRSGLRPLFAEAEDSAAELDGYIDAGEVFVARVEDAIVGHLQLLDTKHGGHCEIKNMAVELSHRGRGIGRSLVA